jgi:hypothetical protein
MKTDYGVQTPAVFLAFNRPDTTARVFAEIAKARSKKLLVVADGPRPCHSGDRCAYNLHIRSQLHPGSTSRDFFAAAIWRMPLGAYTQVIGFLLIW